MTEPANQPIVVIECDRNVLVFSSRTAASLYLEVEDIPELRAFDQSGRELALVDNNGRVAFNAASTDTHAGCVASRLRDYLVACEVGAEVLGDVALAGVIQVAIRSGLGYR